MKRISVRLADEKYLRLRLAAARRGTTIHRLVELAIDSLLAEVAPMAKEPQRRRTEFRGFLASAFGSVDTKLRQSM
jgi:hypothetical protein